MIATIEFLRDHFDLLFRAASAAVDLLRNPALVVATVGAFAAVAYAVRGVQT